MRLLDTATKKLVWFHDEDSIDKPYAILSHTWGADELTLQDLERLQPSGDFTAQNFVKLQGFCDEALRDGFKLAWVDTCCIDKTNITELSEAINSMFRWYQKSARCYVYLDDVEAHDEDQAAPCSAFRSGRWFTRGWTLQEMLAPQNLYFYNKSWKLLGRLEKSSPLTAVVSDITGIPSGFLLGLDLHIASVAQRMSWAASRQTTRKEDMAYSLLGLFGVNLPLIYGEGADRAFRRLQEEIIRHTSDDSILAWGLDLDSSRFSANSKSGPLARSPADFAGCGSLTWFPRTHIEPHFSQTSAGLQIKLPLIRRLGRHKAAAVLDTCDYSDLDHKHGRRDIVIPLEIISDPNAGVGLLTRFLTSNIVERARLFRRAQEPAFRIQRRRFPYFFEHRVQSGYLQDEQINKPGNDMNPLLGYIEVIGSRDFEYRLLHANIVEHPFLRGTASAGRFIDTRPDIQMPCSWNRFYLHITERRSILRSNTLELPREFVAMFEYKHSPTRPWAKTRSLVAEWPADRARTTNEDHLLGNGNTTSSIASRLPQLDDSDALRIFIQTHRFRFWPPLVLRQENVSPALLRIKRISDTIIGWPREHLVWVGFSVFSFVFHYFWYGIGIFLVLATSLVPMGQPWQIFSKILFLWGLLLIFRLRLQYFDGSILTEQLVVFFLVFILSIPFFFLGRT